MRAYNQLVRELDAGGGHYSRDLSEVDVTDPDDVKISIADPAGDIWVYLGSGDFLERYKIYIAHIREWRQQFEKIDSVILRYPGQIIVNPGETDGRKLAYAAAPGAPPMPPSPAAGAHKKKPSPAVARHQKGGGD
jgi:cell division protein FtsQ